MPDHIHAIVTLQGAMTLDRARKQFRGASAQAVNRTLGRTGSVWQRGYFDRLLRIDDRLETVLHYLRHNPAPPGLNFRCRRETWDWFHTCVHDKIEYYEWLKQNP